jgi:hypothetical protein
MGGPLPVLLAYSDTAASQRPSHRTRCLYQSHFSVDEGATDSRVIGVVCYELATCAGARPVPLVTNVAHSYNASGIRVMRVVRDINEPTQACKTETRRELRDTKPS